MTGNPSSVVLEDLFTQEELRYVVKYLSSMTLPIDGKVERAVKFRGIHPEHRMYDWFNRKVFAKICQALERTDLLFANAWYNDDLKPQALHSDYYHVDRGVPGLAMLLPVSVENDYNMPKIVRTVIFNETDTNTVGHDWDRTEWNQNRRPKDNNAVQYSDTYLAHLRQDDLECLTVQNIVEWKPGSVICWDERLLHASDDFLKSNINSKQAIIIHSYVLQ